MTMILNTLNSSRRSIHCRDLIIRLFSQFGTSNWSINSDFQWTNGNFDLLWVISGCRYCKYKTSERWSQQAGNIVIAAVIILGLLTIIISTSISFHMVRRKIIAIGTHSPWISGSDWNFVFKLWMYREQKSLHNSFTLCNSSRWIRRTWIALTI